MDYENIISILEKNGMNDCEELVSNDSYIVIKFCYDFDKDEISAARKYANEESGLEEDSSDWYDNYYLAYLLDIAKDNIQEVVEEVCEEFDIEGEFREIEENESAEYMKGIVIFCEDSSDIDLEEILSDYM